MNSIYMNIENDFPKNDYKKSKLNKNNTNNTNTNIDMKECNENISKNYSECDNLFDDSELKFSIKESFDNPDKYDDLNIYDEQYNKYVNVKYYILSVLIILILLIILMYFLFKK